MARPRLRGPRFPARTTLATWHGMDNTAATRPRSPLRGDPYRALEELPAEVRRALHEALVDWCPLRAREWLAHLQRREGLRPARAAAALVLAIRRLDHAEVVAFAGRWLKGAAAYPHLAAGATLQRYRGAAGLAPPVPAAPAAVAAPARPEPRPKPRPKVPPKRTKPGPVAKRRRAR